MLFLEPLETRVVPSTLQNFDDLGTPFVGGQFGEAPPGPTVLPGGPTGNFLRLADATVPNINTIAFDLADPGPLARMTADFDFRITPVNGRADGIGFALLSTQAFGTTGAVGPPAPLFIPEDPNFAGSLGVGFDIFENPQPSDPNANHVSIHFNGSTLTQVGVGSGIDLASGQWINARILVRAGAGASDVSVILTPAGQSPVTVIDRFPVPGLQPYESRVWLGARSGGETARHDVDNIRVRPSRLAFDAQPRTVVPGQAISPAVSVRVVDPFGNVDPSFNAPVTVSLGANPGGANLAGTLTTSAVNGQATFPNLNLDNFGSGFTLVASTANLPPATSQPFNVTPITITASANVTLVNQPVTFTVKVFSPVPFQGTPFGTVTLSVDGRDLGTVPVRSDGRATFTTTALQLAPGATTTTNVVSAKYNDPIIATTTVTVVGLSGPGVPVTTVLGPGDARIAGNIPDGAPAGTLAGTLRTNSPLQGQFVPATVTLVPNFGDNSLFTIGPGSTAEVVHLLTRFPADFKSRPSFTIQVRSDIGLGEPAIQTFTLVVAAPPQPAEQGGSTIAAFDPSGAFSTWYLGSANGGNGAPAVLPYGGPNWTGVLGDWTGKGFDSVGVVNPSGLVTLGAITYPTDFAFWYLRNTNNPDAPAFPDNPEVLQLGPFPFGLRTWVPVVGDWDGDGVTTVGAFDPASGTWYLRNANNPGAPDIAPFAYGVPGWTPVVGDWDGDGTDTVGVMDPATGTWYLRNSNSAGAPDVAPFAYGVRGWIPVVGDWDGDNVTTVGIFDPAAAAWYLRNANSPGAPAMAPFAFGFGGWVSLSGRFTSPGVPQLAAGGARITSPSMQTLTDRQLQDAVTAALVRLQQAGIDPLVLDVLTSADYAVARLPGALLAVTTADGRVLLSPDAAGHGWFTDASPASDGAFPVRPGTTPAPPENIPADHMDLLTVLLHEMTHLAGQPDFPDDGHGGDLRADALAPGVRRLDALDALFSGRRD